MKVKIIRETGSATLFQSSLERALTVPPKDLFVHDVQTHMWTKGNNLRYAAVVIYGEVPTT